jgi:23S rRNA maturation mini-RNase III
MENNDQFDFQLEESKRDAFYKVVLEKYDGDMHAALRKAIDYFLMYEQSTSLKSVSEKLKEIQEKISNIRNMNAKITDTLKDINEKNSLIQEKKHNQKKNQN